MADVFIAGAARTAVGGFAGGLKDVPVVDLGARTIRESITRAGFDKEAVDEVIMGCVISAGHDLDPARVAALNAGLDQSVPAFTINKACGSGLKAVALAYQAIRSQDAGVLIAGGMENMNRIPYALPDARFGYRMGDAPIIDLMTKGLTCPINNVHMGVTAEEIRKRHNISREEQDRFAADSYAKAVAAAAEGRFADEIVAYEVPQRRGDAIVFDKDDDVRETSLEKLAGLRAAFEKDGTVTAGNASGVNDGAATVAVFSEAKLKELNVTPQARIVAHASAGVEPLVMGLGPAYAIPKCLDKAGWKIEDVDLWELNEAFAAQSLGVLKLLPELDIAKVNVNGGAVAIGHPVGASGCRVLVTLIHALKQRGKTKGVASLCIGTGMGIAMAIELV